MPTRPLRPNESLRLLNSSVAPEQTTAPQRRARTRTSCLLPCLVHVESQDEPLKSAIVSLSSQGCGLVTSDEAIVNTAFLRGRRCSLEVDLGIVPEGRLTGLIREVLPEYYPHGHRLGVELVDLAPKVVEVLDLFVITELERQRREGASLWS